MMIADIRETHDLVWAAIVTGFFGVVAVVISNRHQRNMKSLSAKIDVTNDRLDTGNGVKIGKAVYRLEQQQDIILGNQTLQMATLQEHGHRLSELSDFHEEQGVKITRIGDVLNDHLLSLEEAAEQLAARGRLHVRKTDATEEGN